MPDANQVRRDENTKGIYVVYRIDVQINADDMYESKEEN